MIHVDTNISIKVYNACLCMCTGVQMSRSRGYQTQLKTSVKKFKKHYQKCIHSYVRLKEGLGKVHIEI